MRIESVLVSAVLFACAAAAHGSDNYVAVGVGDAKAYWKVAEKGEPIRLPKSAMHKHAEGCVAVGFSIEPDGKVGNPVVIRSGFTDQADRQVIRDVEQRVVRNFATTHWVAADGNPNHTPVYTYGIYSFSLYERPSSQSEIDARSDFVKATCEIADFPAAVARGDLVAKPPSH
jgi:hypothetical protein